MSLRSASRQAHRELPCWTQRLHPLAIREVEGGRGWCRRWVLRWRPFRVVRWRRPLGQVRWSVVVVLLSGRDNWTVAGYATAWL